MTDPTIITLSSIPPRFSSLGPVLRSLLGQSLPAAEVRLYIPASYRRFPDWDGTLPAVPDGVSLHRCEADLGPATKVLPALEDLAGQSVDVLFCDDDKVYDADWHRRLKSVRAERPNACIVEAGENLPDIADSARPKDRLPRAQRRQKDWSYRVRRIASLTMIKPHLYGAPGYVDQISAYAGVMLRPGWLDDKAWDIPDEFRMVDDPWLSGHLERMGVPIWMNLAPNSPRPLRSGKTHSLLKLVEDGRGRVAADNEVVEYFRREYEIWQPSGPVDTDTASMTGSMRELARRAIEQPGGTT